MKKIICWATFLLICASHTLWAQSNVIVMRYIAGCQKKVTDAKFSDWQDIDNTIKVVMDFDKMIIQFYNKANTKFDLLYLIKEGKDHDGDNYLEYQAIDEEGIKCRVRLIADKENNHVYLYAFYNNITFGFLLSY
ncbi:MAG: hypothetical protein RMJ87_02765 [Cytophagales bacterium]|nr:hypothetical protein [Bernardetiaceae bacterium]MDW8203928.1 hypothetical protein [Cytophagales bacterium]